MMPGLEVDVYLIENHFFGENITVAGLVTGKDLAEQLAGQDLGDELLLPEVMLRDGEDVFLCGMTVGELSEKLGKKITIVPVDGAEFIEKMLG
jgi:NifB/MoaA-like Fe-S oxidoreductase